MQRVRAYLVAASTPAHDATVRKDIAKNVMGVVPITKKMNPAPIVS